jgi:hypothetical protein
VSLVNAAFPGCGRAFSLWPGDIEYAQVENYYIDEWFYVPAVGRSTIDAYQIKKTNKNMVLSII